MSEPLQHFLGTYPDYSDSEQARHVGSQSVTQTCHQDADSTHDGLYDSIQLGSRCQGTREQ
jgi:hypothetical protein